MLQLIQVPQLAYHAYALTINYFNLKACQNPKNLVDKITNNKVLKYVNGKI